MGMANKQNCGGVPRYSEAITNKPRMVSRDRRTKEGSVAEVHSVEERVLQALFKGTDKEVYRRNTRHQMDPI
jgi:hypothetical protein